MRYFSGITTLILLTGSIGRTPAVINGEAFNVNRCQHLTSLSSPTVGFGRLHSVTSYVPRFKGSKAFLDNNRSRFVTSLLTTSSPDDGIAPAPTLAPTAEPTSADSSVDPVFGSDLLVLDMEVSKRQIAQNWGFILLAGVASMISGFYLLASPIIGTEYALLSTVFTLFTIGSINIIGSVFFQETGNRFVSLVLGVAQIALGGLMGNLPGDAIASITVLVAFKVFGDGLYRVLLGAQNRGSMDGWWVVVANGLLSMIGAAYALNFLDVSRFFVPGLTLGWGLVNSGCSRIVASMFGRSYANSNMMVVDDAVLSAV
jgi:uncharacterized membrane protein HdeD (DUF308 family)